MEDEMKFMLLNFHDDDDSNKQNRQRNNSIPQNYQQERERHGDLFYDALIK